MPRTTRPLLDRIALVFDLTLAPGTIDAVLARFGIDHASWREREVGPLIADGWDEIQAKGALLRRRLSKVNGNAITHDFLRDVGRGLEPFPQTQPAPEGLCALGREVSGGAEVELYVLSAGFTAIIAASRSSR